MKRSLSLIVFVGLASAFTIAPLSAATSREDKRLQRGVITKNEAQHLVLKKYPGAKINHCELKKTDGHSVWSIDVTPAGAQKATTVQIDGRSGKMTP